MKPQSVVLSMVITFGFPLIANAGGVTIDELSNKPVFHHEQYENKKHKGPLKLLWFNHFEEGRMYEVLNAHIPKPAPDQLQILNNLYKKCCKPFDTAGTEVVSAIQVAGDEHFKDGTQPSNSPWRLPGQHDLNHPHQRQYYSRFEKSPYNLPHLEERWFQIMDDERWWIVEMKPEEPNHPPHH